LNHRGVYPGSVSHRRRLVLVANPAAGGGSAARVIPQVVDGLEGAGVDVVLCREASAEALTTTLARELTSDPDGVVALGGDGTVHLVINALGDRPVCPMGIIPIGTGNDIASSWGIPSDTDGALECLLAGLQGEPRKVDVGVIAKGENTTRFGAVYSAGFDAIVNERANSMRFPRGSSRYILALLIELASLRPRRYRLTIDGVSREQDALLVAVANGPSFGGGMRVAPDASLTDGLLDVFVLTPVSRLTFLRIFPKVYSGTHISHPAVEIIRASEVSVDVEGIVGYVDGERHDSLPVSLHVNSSALSILA
jgi:diacylglycerol kinase (ATP)